MDNMCTSPKEKDSYQLASLGPKNKKHAGKKTRTREARARGKKHNVLKVERQPSETEKHPENRGKHREECS